MNKKSLFLLLLFFPVWTASTIVVKEGLREVGTVETHDGSSEEEVVSKKKLKEEAGGYTQVKAEDLKNTENVISPFEKKKDPNASVGVPAEAFRGNYGIVEGITERDVEGIASRENMGIPNKTTEYSAGSTYPVRTWEYAFEADALKHVLKVHFDTDGKVISVTHQTE